MIYSDTVKGSLLMIGSMVGFTVNDAFMRGVLHDLPLMQSVFLRGLLITVVLFLLARHRGALRFRPSRHDHKMMIWRSGAELLATFAFLSTLTLMKFANISAIMQVIPLSVTLAAAVFAGASIGWRRMAAILIGFIGVLIIIRPGVSDFNSASLLVLLAVAIVTVRDLAARFLSANIPSVLVALHASVLVTLVNGILAIGQGWEAVSMSHLLLLVGASASLTLGYICSVAAMRVGDIATIAPFRYSSLLSAILLGYFVFNEIPDALTLLGSAIIVAMGVFSFYREQKVQAVLATQK